MPSCHKAGGSLKLSGGAVLSFDLMLYALKSALENPVFASVVAVLNGLCIGSFLNVVIARVPAGKSISDPPSSCPSCGTRIRWYDNIPVLSWLALRGKCRVCGWSIPARYPLVEISGGILALLVVLSRSGAPVVLTGLAVAWSLLAITMIDLDHKIIPDAISLPGFALLLGTSWLPGRGGVVSALLGALLGAGMFWIVREAYYRTTGREGLGFGDVKLMALLGALLGPFGVCISVFAASAVGLAAGLVMIMAGRANRRTEIPFGPYLAAGGFLVFLSGGQAETLVRGFFRSIMRGVL